MCGNVRLTMKKKMFTANIILKYYENTSEK